MRESSRRARRSTPRSWSRPLATVLAGQEPRGIRAHRYAPKRPRSRDAEPVPGSLVADADHPRSRPRDGPNWGLERLGLGVRAGDGPPGHFLGPGSCRDGVQIWPEGAGTPCRTSRTPPPSGSPAPAAHPPEGRSGRAGCARLNFVRLTLRIYHLQGPVTIRYAPHVFGVRHHPLQWVFRASEMSYRLRLAAAPADSAHGAGEEWARLEVTRTQRTAVRESVFSGPRVEGELMQHVEPMRFHRCFQDSASQA